MKTVSLKIPAPLNAKLTRCAKNRGTNKSAIMRSALEAYLKGELPVEGLTCGDLAGDLFGVFEGPVDLATNQKYMKDFGK